MAQQYISTAMPSSQADQSNLALVPASAPSTTSTSPVLALTPSPPPAEYTAGLHTHTQQSMALIPTSSAPTTSTASALTPASTAGVGLSSTAERHQFAQLEGEEAWSVVTRSLMVALMGSQPPAMAASTLLGVFRPIVDGWAGARKEGKRWKDRAEVYMAEHHKHKIELAHKHNALQAQVEDLQKSLAESQSREGELERQQSVLHANVSSLEKQLGEAQAQARATKEAQAHEAQESKRELQAMAKSAQDAKVMYENLRQQGEDMTRAHNAEIVKLHDKMKEVEGIKTKLDEQLNFIIAKNTSLEADVAQKAQDITNLQTRVTELTTRKDALERQLALYQRIPTRRF